MDGLADAQTLINVHDAHRGLTGCWQGTEFQPCCDLANCLGWAWVAKFELTLGHDPYPYVVESVRAYHRFSESLEGDKRAEGLED